MTAKQISTIEKNIAKTEERLAKLEAALIDLVAEEEKYQEELGAAVLANGADVSELENKIARTKARNGSVSAGIRQANKALAKMQADLEEKRREQITQDTQKMVARIQGEMIDVLDQIRATHTKQLQWGQALNEAQIRCQEIGLDQEARRVNALLDLWYPAGNLIRQIIDGYDSRLVFTDSTMASRLESPNLAVVWRK